MLAPAAPLPPPCLAWESRCARRRDRHAGARSSAASAAVRSPDRNLTTWPGSRLTTRCSPTWSGSGSCAVRAGSRRGPASSHHGGLQQTRPLFRRNPRFAPAGNHGQRPGTQAIWSAPGDANREFARRAGLDLLQRRRPPAGWCGAVGSGGLGLPPRSAAQLDPTVLRPRPGRRSPARRVAGGW
jgi:hypothetical protein